jgi:hypothetical protein
MARSAAQQLDAFIDRYTPDIAANARAILGAMRERLPGSVELVYDNTYTLAIGFAPTERTSTAIVSIALYPRWINLFFLRGATLPDPKKLLQGSGKVVRHIRIDDAAQLASPAIAALMKAALAASEPIDPTASSRIIIKLASKNPRPRRPA